jgi:hypothetical protein
MNSQSVWTPPEVAALDEGRWQAWVAKCAKEACLRATKWVAILGLFAGAVLWSRAALFEVVVGFLVAAGAIAAMLQSLFNPVAPVFDFSGNWRRLLVASVAPFVLSRPWRNPEAVV